jgi:cobalamin biosynthesis protein CobW
MTRQVELPGGCICCQLDEDLARTLAELVASAPDLELAIIETTGVADPLPIGWTLQRPPLDRLVRLAGVFTVVDALHHAAHRPESPSVDAQVAGADVLVVSKLDLAPTGSAELGVLGALAAQNSDAPIVAAPPDEAAAATWHMLADPALGETRGARPEPASHGHDHAHHGHDLESVSLTIDNVLDLEELTEALEGLPPSVVRIKGIAEVVDRSTGASSTRQVAFHRVGARVSSEPLGPPARPHRMVAIGRGLDRAALVACLRAAVIG